MKRFWLIFVFMLLACVGYDSYEYLGDFIKNSDATYSIYTSDVCDANDVEIIDVGAGYIVSCGVTDGEKVFNALKQNAYGQSVSLKGDLNYCKSLITSMGVKVVKCENFNNIYNIYGIGDFGNKIVVDGQKFNVQIAYRDGVVTIGCPVILGSY